MDTEHVEERGTETAREISGRQERYVHFEFRGHGNADKMPWLREQDMPGAVSACICSAVPGLLLGATSARSGQNDREACFRRGL